MNKTKTGTFSDFLPLANIYGHGGYYPTAWSGCNPIHAVYDWSYVRQIIRASQSGICITPILLDGGLGGGNLLAGTHRCAANDIMQALNNKHGVVKYRLIPYVCISNIDMCDYAGLQDAIDCCDYEAIDDIWDKKKKEEIS